jgi:dephospho-CoA kinase
MSRPYVIVITGGAGAGKSTAARRFQRHGALLIDSDEVSRQVLEDPATREDLVRAFGPSILDAAGGVDRERLADAAFKGTNTVARLNAATHPRIVAEVLARLQGLAAGPAQPVVVLEIPLIEAVPDLTAMADEVLAVEAPLTARVGRLVARGIPEPDARRRIGLQLADPERRRYATAVVVNDSTPDVFEDRLDRAWAHLSAAFRAAGRVAGGEQDHVS